MSYSFSDSVAGKPIDITYGAAQLALPRHMARGQRARVVRQHLSSHRAKHALIVRGDRETEVWWAADSAGVSIAAAIETWLDGQERCPDKCGVIVPLDVAVYIAQVETNLVTDERILPVEKAAEELHEAAARGHVAYAFTGGGAQAAIEQHVTLEPLPFDLFEYAYTPAWKVFLKAGMLHASHIAGIAALVIAVAVLAAAGPVAERVVRGGWNLIAERLGIAEEASQQALQAPAASITPEVDFSAARHMRSLAGLLANLEHLYRDGISDISVASVPPRITLRGKAKAGFPESARQFALNTGSRWSYSTQGWTISMPADWGTDRRPPEITLEESLKKLLEQPAGLTLTGGPEEIRGTVNLLANTVTQTLYKTTYMASLDSSAIGALTESANLLQEIPAALTRADCAFADWQINSCELTFEVKTL